MIIHSYRKKYLIFPLIVPLIMIIFSPSISLGDADKIFKENSKAVVVIVTYDEKGKPIGQGSGFIVRADGAVITNYHVISNAVDIAIKAGDKVLEVEGFLHIDKENDLVILKAKAKNLPTAKIGDINKTSIGEKVYVISSPEGLENTISDGILSGIREITPQRKILQITAPISSGSSGGPVFNKNGKVIGIATLLIKEAQNLNFAMPVNLIKDKISAKKITALRDATIEDYKKTAEYWFYLGLAYYDAGMYKDAIEAFIKAIKIKPDDAEAHGSLGVAYYDAGMYREAIEAFKEAIKIKPDYAEALGSLGAIYGVLAMYKDAIETFKRVIKIKPDDAEAPFGLGLAYEKLDMHKESVEAFKQAIKIKPDYAEAYYNLCVVYGKSSMYGEAIDACRRAIRIKPDYAESHFILGIDYGELHMYREAIEAFKQVIRIKPEHAEAHYFLGLAYIILKDRGAALEEYKILKNLNPELANNLFNVIYK